MIDEIERAARELIKLLKENALLDRFTALLTEDTLLHKTVDLFIKQVQLIHKFNLENLYGLERKLEQFCVMLEDYDQSTHFGKTKEFKEWVKQLFKNAHHEK